MMDGCRDSYRVEERFKGWHFDQEIVVLCVPWYLSFRLICAGCSITVLNSRSAGTDSRERQVARGEWVKRTFG
jgi:hypothetical protein